MLCILGLLSCKNASHSINIETKHFRYTFSQQGQNQSFTDLASGKDYLYRDSLSYIAYITSGNRVYTPDEVGMEDHRLVLKFNDPGVVAYVSLKNEADYIVVTVDSIAGAASAFNFLNIPLTLEALPDEPFSACV